MSHDRRLRRDLYLQERRRSRGTNGEYNDKKTVKGSFELHKRTDVYRVGGKKREKERRRDIEY